MMAIALTLRSSEDMCRRRGAAAGTRQGCPRHEVPIKVAEWLSYLAALAIFVMCRR
jgi:hypothetical protein